MRTFGNRMLVALWIPCGLMFAQGVTTPDAPRPKSWTRELKERSQRGTLHDAIQSVRGDTGRWSDKPQALHAPPLMQKPANTSLDDWFDLLLESRQFRATVRDDNWLLLRTRQLDDNDRVWVERIQRQGNQFTITLHEATWQGKYFKTFTFYRVFGVNLGKLEPGEYKAKWVIMPLVFQQFDGDGRPTSKGPSRPVDHWPKDDMAADTSPVELSVTFAIPDSSS